MFLKAITIIVLLVTMTSVSFATCADMSGGNRTDEQFRKYLDGFQNIFLGEVIAAEQRDSFTQTLNVKVLRRWRGSDDNEVKLVYTAGDEEYGFLNIGAQEIFYAYPTAQGVLLIPHCGKTSWRQDERMQSILGPGQEILPSQSPVPAQGESFWPWLWQTIKRLF